MQKETTSVSLHIRMSVADAERLKELAAERGMRRVEYIREALGLGVYRRVGPPLGSRNNPAGRPRRPKARPDLLTRPEHPG